MRLDPRRHLPLLVAMAGGAVFALSSPPTDLLAAVIVGLAMLSASLHGAPTFFQGFWRGAAWATVAGIVGLRFVPSVIQRFTTLGVAPSYVALVLLAAAQSLPWAVGAGVSTVLERRARAPRELSFAAGTLVALSIPTVFAWTPAGLMTPWPSLVQLGDLVGERGVSVLLAVGAALLGRAALALVSHLRTPEPKPSPRSLLRATALPLGLAAALFGGLAVHGALRIASVRREMAALPTARIGLVNQAVGPLERWDARNQPRILRTLRDLTKRAEADGVELTIWPEAAYPHPVEHDASKAPRGPKSPVGAGVRGPLLIGLITRARPSEAGDGRVEQNSYNSASLVLPDGSLTRPQDKLQLLWFGETVPGGAYLPWLRRMFQRSGGLIPGDGPRELRLERAEGPALRMSVLNCYEDTLTNVGRRMAGAVTPNLLVNVTNDAWFAGTAEAELHARLAAMRAVELRRDLVRAVNLGVVSWVDAAGIERARDAGEHPLHVVVTPAIRDGALTFYARFGDAPVMLTLLGAALACALRRRPT